MAAARLKASVEASSLIRRVEADGGFGAVLRKGDPERGALLLVVRSRGRHVACLERMLSADGCYRWAAGGPVEAESDEKLAEFLAKRVRFDEDLWLIELDIAQPERFIAETTLRVDPVGAAGKGADPSEERGVLFCRIIGGCTTRDGEPPGGRCGQSPRVAAPPGWAVHRTCYGYHGGFDSLGATDLCCDERQFSCAGPGRPDRKTADAARKRPQPFRSR
jgi:hypothetical protein